MYLLMRPWRLYADFSGRSQRTEYFLYFIVLYGVIGVLAVLGGAFARSGDYFQGFQNLGSGIAMTILILLVLASIIPSWAVTVRRLHDQDKSGWFALLSFIPYVGGLIVLVLAFLPGTPGENDYGFDPRTDEAEDPDRLSDVFS